MDSLTPIHQVEGCEISAGPNYIRGEVGHGLAVEVQKCYRHFVHECLQRKSTRALIIGQAKWDAFYHLALRDALRSMAMAGLPKGFRLALVAGTPDLIAVYDAALMEALRLGIEAKRFQSEAEAVAWLTS
jgi:hypothetical protein